MALTDENMNTQLNDDVVDLTINVAKRTRFRINGDNSKIIELNLSDFGFAVRLKEGAKKLSEKVMLVQNYDSEDENFSEKGVCRLHLRLSCIRSACKRRYYV